MCVLQAVAKHDLKLPILPLPSPKCWDFRYAPLCLAL